jgi:hypothetical protein
MEGGYVGYETNIGCSSPRKTKNMLLLEIASLRSQ